MKLNRHFRPVLTLAFALIFLYLNITCSSVTAPEEEQPGRRDYVWRVDTLKVPEGRSLPSRMWGANANDVWAIGIAYLNAYCIWHFDGINWKNYVPDKYIEPYGIWGTSSNNIWIGSTDGAFWHYDGFRWSKFQETNIPNYRPFVVQNIFGKSPKEIYAVGYADSIDGSTYKAVIMKFDGVKWSLVNIPTIKNSFKKILYDEGTGKYLISAWVFNTPNEYIYLFDGQNLNQIYSAQDFLNLVTIGNKTYLQTKNKILRYNGSNFEYVLEIKSDKYIGNAWGRNEKDIFTVNYDGIGHYNGIDLITIFIKHNIDWSPRGGIVFEKDVFFIWDDSYSTFIVHGRLNN